MIRFIKGKFYPQTDGSIVVETSSGIGFSMTIPSNCPLYKHYEGEEVKAYTYMAVREDDISLYGFSSTDELLAYDISEKLGFQLTETVEKAYDLGHGQYDTRLVYTKQIG